MAGPTPARRAALETLRSVRRGVLGDVALDRAARDLDARDRAWLQELVFGTFRLRGRLDHVLATFSTRPLERLDPDIHDILRLAAYELTEMGGVPAYATISQGVELARSTSARAAAGFVNGVLQSLRRAGGQWTFPPFATDPVGHLSSWGSHPRWLVERWVGRYGAAAARELVEANNERPRLYLRLLGDVAAARDRLAATGVATEPVPWEPHAVAIDAGDTAAALAAAPVIVQDPAAGAVASFVAAPAGATLVDVAAAPGGKTLALAYAEPPPHYVAALDLSARRLRRVRENVTRLAPLGQGRAPVGLVVADGRAPPCRPVDVVVLDAPCTGTGTLRRHADGRWRLQPPDITQLAALQRTLLDGAAAVVAPGGLLVYATCSLEPEENEVQVEEFLSRHGAFGLEPGPVADATLLAADGTLRVLPHRHGADGAFAARLRRSA